VLKFNEMHRGIYIFFREKLRSLEITSDFFVIKFALALPISPIYLILKSLLFNLLRSCMKIVVLTPLVIFCELIYLFAYLLTFTI